MTPLAPPSPFPTPIAGTPDALLRQVTRANDNTLREALLLWGIPDVGTVTGDTTLAATRQHVRVDATVGPITVTLPPLANTAEGVVISIKRINAGANAVTVARSGADTIDGATTDTLASQYAALTVIATGAGWDTIAEFPPSGGGGGGTSITTGTAVVDFGAFPGGSDASVVITGQTTIAATSVVQAWLNPIDTADHTADEHRVEPLSVAAHSVIAGTGFTVSVVHTSDLFEPLELAGVAKFRSAATSAYGASSPSVGGRAPRVYGQWSVRWQWYTP